MFSGLTNWVNYLKKEKRQRSHEKRAERSRTLSEMILYDRTMSHESYDSSTEVTLRSRSTTARSIIRAKYRHYSSSNDVNKNYDINGNAKTWTNLKNKIRNRVNTVPNSGQPKQRSSYTREIVAATLNPVPKIDLRTDSSHTYRPVIHDDGIAPTTAAVTQTSVSTQEPDHFFSHANQKIRRTRSEGSVRFSSTASSSHGDDRFSSTDNVYRLVGDLTGKAYTTASQGIPLGSMANSGAHYFPEVDTSRMLRARMFYDLSDSDDDVLVPDNVDTSSETIDSDTEIRAVVYFTPRDQPPLPHEAIKRRSVGSLKGNDVYTAVTSEISYAKLKSETTSHMSMNSEVESSNDDLNNDHISNRYDAHHGASNAHVTHHIQVPFTNGSIMHGTRQLNNQRTGQFVSPVVYGMNPSSTSAPSSKSLAAVPVKRSRSSALLNDYTYDDGFQNAHAMGYRDSVSEWANMQNMYRYADHVRRHNSGEYGSEQVYILRKNYGVF